MKYNNFMVPFIIQQAIPAFSINERNIQTNYHVSINIDINKTIIEKITDIMIEFCSDYSGHNIEISSYQDFCDKYREINDCCIKYFEKVFIIYYFSDEWTEWNISNYEINIFENYEYKIKQLKK